MKSPIYCYATVLWILMGAMGIVHNDVVAQRTFDVLSTEDLPDTNLGDGIYYPPTLRSAIQNANLTPAADVIKILTPASDSLLFIFSNLPLVTQPLDIDGKGKTLRPSSPLANAGFSIQAGNSSVHDWRIENFQDAAIYVGSIPTQVTNDSVYGNFIRNCGGGVNLNNASGCFIGGASVYFTNTFVELRGHGIQLYLNSNNNQIINNLIGTNGIIPRSNAGIGILVETSGNRIVGNVIAAKRLAGIEVNSASSSFNVIQNNKIGTDDGGLAGFRGQYNGISILRSANDTIQANIISANGDTTGNNGNGIAISSPAIGTYIVGNIVGLKANGIDTLGNPSGINSSGSNISIIGNTVSGNLFSGVALQANAAGSLSVVRGNRIGTDTSGTFGRGNRVGIQISGLSSNHVVGGPLARDRNIISGNTVSGIEASLGTNSLIQGNYVGLDKTGTAAISNGEGMAILQLCTGTQVVNNVISGNQVDGIRIAKRFTSSPTSIKVIGNIIGLAADGQTIVANGGHGIRIHNSQNNIIGDQLPEETNYIGGNGGHGMYLLGDGTTGNTITNNSIGVGIGGVQRPNLSGIVIDSASNNFIGSGPIGAPQNIIANNAGDGVRVLTTAQGNFVRFNSIYANGELGIDLANEGVTPNDPLDVDLGPNALQNFPVLQLATMDTSLHVYGRLNSTPLAAFQLDFYTNDICDPTNFGEGKTYQGPFDVTTNSTGTVWFHAILPAIPITDFITATAIDSADNTSEFARCIPISPPGVYADLIIAVTDSADTVGLADTLTYHVSVLNDGPNPAANVLVLDTLSQRVTFLSDSSTHGTCTYSNGVLTCTIPVLAPFTGATITVVATADSSGTAITRARVTASTVDFDPTNNADTDTTHIQTSTGLAGHAEVPLEFSLDQNYPNPFNPTTRLVYRVGSREHVGLKVYDLLGREVATLVAEVKEPGEHSVTLDGSHLSSGVYFYRLSTSGFVQTKKLILLR